MIVPIPISIVLLAAAALLALAYRISSLLLHPPRQPLARTPRDCGLAYEDVQFPGADGLLLSGWWIPAPREIHAGETQAVVLVHPTFGNRHGYSAAPLGRTALLRSEVDLLKTASGLHQAGYAVLMFDLRGHGQSAGGMCAGGLCEDQDVTGAVDYAFDRLRAEKPRALQPRVGLVAFGLGATAAIAAVGRMKGGAERTRVFTGDNEGGVGYIEIPPANIKLVSFLAAVQPASAGRLVRGALGLPGSALLPLVDFFCQRRGGYPLDLALPLKFAGGLTVPTLYIQARTDPWGAAREVQQLYDATPAPRQIEWIEQPLARLEVYDYLGDHLEAVLGFAARHMPE